MAGQPTRTRPPAVAGRFYPRGAAELAQAVDRLLDSVQVAADEPLAAAYVVPHAGYVFSGPTAAHVYARLRRHASQVQRVVLIGPAHFAPLTGCAVPAAGAWATPLGELPVAGTDRLAGLATVDDAPHAPEHALEVQVPFLQRALGRPVPVLPVAVGQSPAGEVAACLGAAAALEPGTLVLCSTDLSHYLDQAAAVAQDGRTAEAIMALAPDRVGRRDACGVYALRGLLAWAANSDLHPELLDLATSADTAGEPSRVVGYGAFALHADRSTGAQRSYSSS